MRAHQTNTTGYPGLLSARLPARVAGSPWLGSLFVVLFALGPALTFLAPLSAKAEEGITETAPISQEKLDSLLAPVALYPDQLLGQVLMASTYPLDVVAAARFVKENKGLKGEALDNAVSEKNWDPSVQSLTAYPQVLEMMNDKLEWTQELGDAFLADEARIMATVQTLRQKADAAGNLKSGEQQKVIREQTTIIIEPARPEVVYVPTYNPTVVYGPWWAPAYPPYYWSPPVYYHPPGGLFIAGMIGFGIGWAIHDNHWGWCRPNWRGGNVYIDVHHHNVFINKNPHYRSRVNNGHWRHNPVQRKGVAYRDVKTREHYRVTHPQASSVRRPYGSPGEGAKPGTRPRPQPGQAAPHTRPERPTKPAPAPESGRTREGKPGMTPVQALEKPAATNRPAPVSERPAPGDKSANPSPGRTREQGVNSGRSRSGERDSGQGLKGPGNAGGQGMGRP
jgi:hypothetical protein